MKILKTFKKFLESYGGEEMDTNEWPETPIIDEPIEDQEEESSEDEDEEKDSPVEPPVNL